MREPLHDALQAPTGAGPARQLKRPSRPPSGAESAASRLGDCPIGARSSTIGRVPPPKLLNARG